MHKFFLSFAIALAAASNDSKATEAKACLSTGCYDLMTTESLSAYLAVLENKSPEAETDADYSDLSIKKREKVRDAEMSLVRSALNPPSHRSRSFYVNTIREVRRSLELRNANPYPDGVDVVKLPVGLVADIFRSPFVRGKKPSTAEDQVATFRVDRDIENLDLRTGMRPALPPGSENSVVCEYDKKKDSHGTNPGFTVNCGKDKLKVKFGEMRTEPFQSRIMWALGYHVDPADYASIIRVRYNRKIFSEFNTHPGVRVRLKVAKIPTVNVRVVKPGVSLDSFLDHAVLKDGSRISAEELLASLGDPLLESKLDIIAFKSIQIQRDNPDVIKIGAWSYNDFDHRDNEDMRAVVIATAWLANSDIRLDNNRFALDLSGERPEWKFLISDLGVGMGRSTSRYAILNSSDDLDGFSRSVAKKDRLSRYQTFEKNKAFKRATREEASRVAARIMRLSESQISVALSASGYSPDESAAFLRELLRRRDELARAFPSK